MGAWQQDSTSGKAGANSQAHHPPSFPPFGAEVRKVSGLLQSALLGGLRSPLHGDQPDWSVCKRPTASCRVQALPLPHPRPPHQTVPRVCLLPHHLDSDCAGWRSPRTRRRSGMWSCRTWAPAGSAPLDAPPLLPREKSSQGHTQARGLGDGSGQSKVEGGHRSRIASPVCEEPELGPPAPSISLYHLTFRSQKSKSSGSTSSLPGEL